MLGQASANNGLRISRLHEIAPRVRAGGEIPDNMRKMTPRARTRDVISNTAV